MEPCPPVTPNESRAAEKAKEASKTVIAYAKEKPDMAALFVLGVLNLFS